MTVEQAERITAEIDARDSLAIFDRILQGPLGEKIPSVMSKTLSLRPDIFSAVMAAGKPILFEGVLSVDLKQMIVMFIASRRNCEFCTEVHRAMLESLGIENDLIQNCLEDPDLNRVSPAYRQILEFALHAATHPTETDDARFAALRDSGLNEAEILEIAMVVSFANFLVTWADVTAELNG